MNAMAHLMDAMYAPDSNPITHNNTLLGMTRLIQGMKILGKENQLSPEANEQLMFGAFLAGKVLGEVSMALHHKAAHVLGGSFGMEHSKVHTVLQPYVLEYQWEELIPEIKEHFQDIFSHPYPPSALKKLSSIMGASTSLMEIGFKEEDIAGAAELMSRSPYPNPSPLKKERIMEMLRNAYQGNLVGE